MGFSDETLWMVHDGFEKLIQSFKQMDVDRKLREELRLDSQKLREELRLNKLTEFFIPKRFEDLRLNGGIRIRRIPIKLIYHKARFKNRKARRMRENRHPVTQKLGLTTNSLRLSVKSVGMKKQYHGKKKTTQVKLAQACKSLGMFQDSPSFRYHEDYMQICLGRRSTVNTGVKRWTHHFGDGSPSLVSVNLVSHVVTMIEDQNNFSKNAKELEHGERYAVQKTFQDGTTPVIKFDEMSKHKSSDERSHVRGLHKVRFIGGSEQRSVLVPVSLPEKLVIVNTQTKAERVLISQVEISCLAEALKVIGLASVGTEDMIAFDPRGKWYRKAHLIWENQGLKNRIERVWEPGGLAASEKASKLIEKLHKSVYHGVSQELSQVIEPSTQVEGFEDHKLLSFIKSHNRIWEPGGIVQLRCWSWVDKHHHQLETLDSKLTRTPGVSVKSWYPEILLEGFVMESHENYSELKQQKFLNTILSRGIKLKKDLTAHKLITKDAKTLQHDIFDGESEVGRGQKHNHREVSQVTMEVYVDYTHVSLVFDPRGTNFEKDQVTARQVQSFPVNEDHTPWTSKGGGKWLKKVVLERWSANKWSRLAFCKQQNEIGFVIKEDSTVWELELLEKTCGISLINFVLSISTDSMMKFLLLVIFHYTRPLNLSTLESDFLYFADWYRECGFTQNMKREKRWVTLNQVNQCTWAARQELSKSKNGYEELSKTCTLSLAHGTFKAVANDAYEYGQRETWEMFLLWKIHSSSFVQVQNVREDDVEPVKESKNRITLKKFTTHQSEIMIAMVLVRVYELFQSPRPPEQWDSVHKAVVDVAYAAELTSTVM